MRIGSRGLQGERRRGEQGFSLPEVMIAGAVFLMVIGGIVASNYFGLRMISVTEPKLQANAALRQTVTALINDVTSAKSVQVGDGDATGFTNVPAGLPKEGNALEIHPTTDTNDFVRYYLDTMDQSLKRITNGQLSGAVVSAGISNAVVFTGEDFSGNLITNDVPAFVVGIALDYSVLEGSGTPVGPGYYFQAYEFRTRVGWRAR